MPPPVPFEAAVDELVKKSGRVSRSRRVRTLNAPNSFHVTTDTHAECHRKVRDVGKALAVIDVRSIEAEREFLRRQHFGRRHKKRPVSPLAVALADPVSLVLAVPGFDAVCAAAADVIASEADKRCGSTECSYVSSRVSFPLKSYRHVNPPPRKSM